MRRELFFLTLFLFFAFTSPVLAGDIGTFEGTSWMRVTTGTFDNRSFKLTTNQPANGAQLPVENGEWDVPRENTDIFNASLVSTGEDGVESVYAADIDGDGDTDLLSSSENDNTVAWYENDGTETFTQNVITTSEDDPKSVYAADVNGDGDTDVLTAAEDNDRVAWHENNGTEDFTTHVITSSADGPWSVYATDIDGDGDTDVVSASANDDRIIWYENNGSTDATGFTAHDITTTADAASNVYATDVNGDSHIDVLSASFSDDRIAWYENNGTESFTTHNITTSADGAYSVHASDMDGDGDTDVVSGSRNDDRVAWYENDGGDLPTFTTHDIDTDADAASVHATDIDGDGHTDVLAGRQDQDMITWYENNGTEGFTPHTVASNKDAPRSVYAADVNGDGDTDLLSASYSDDTVAWYEHVEDTADSIMFNFLESEVAGSGTVPETADVFNISVYYENKTGKEHLIRQIYRDTTVDDAAPVDGRVFKVWPTHNASKHGKPRSGVFRLRMAACGESDLDEDGECGGTNNWILNSDDGAATLLGSNHFAQGYGRAHLNITDFATYQDPGFTEEETRFMRNETVFIEFKTMGSAWNDTGVETVTLTLHNQFNNKVFTDTLSLVFTNNTYRTQWDMPVDAQLNNYTLGLNVEEDIHAAPLDNLEKHDITDSASSARSVYTADINNDSHTDVLSASFSDDRVAWYENNGSMDTPGFTTYNISTNVDGAQAVSAADLDGDTDIDVVSAAENSDTVTWYEHNGSTEAVGFTPHNITDSANGAKTVKTTDFDGDGDIDVVHGSRVDDTIKWWENNGTANFTGNAVATNSDNVAEIDTGDLNNDGDTDIASANRWTGDTGEDDEIHWYENDGSDTSFTSHDIASGGEPTAVDIVDVDGDGDLDIIAGHDDSNGLHWYENDGTGSFSEHSVTGGSDYENVQGVDFDGDNDTDILYAKENTDTVGWYENDGTESFTHHEITDAAANAFSVHTADVDGDTDTDVLSASKQDNTIAWYETDWFWTAFHSTGKGSHADARSVFNDHNQSDPDGMLHFDDTSSFWVEDEFSLNFSQGFPRANGSTNKTLGPFVNRGEQLNTSMEVMDEWNQSFTNRTLNIEANSSSSLFDAGTATTDGNGVIPNITVGTGWEDTFTGNTPASTEHKDYTFSVFYPANNNDVTGNGSFGNNLSQSGAFDVDSQYYGHVDHRNPQSQYETSETLDGFLRVRTVRNTSVGEITAQYTFFDEDDIAQENVSAQLDGNGENTSAVDVPDMPGPDWKLGGFFTHEGNTFLEKDLEDVFEIIGNPPNWFNLSTSPSSPTLFATPKTYRFNVTWRTNGSNISEVRFHLNGTTDTWENNGSTGGITTHNFNGTEGTFTATRESLPAGGYNFSWTGVSEDEGSNDTDTKIYSVEEFVVTVEATFTSPADAVVVNGDRRGSDGVFDEDENMEYIIGTDNEKLFGLVDYTTQSAEQQGIGWRDNTDTHRFNMTQTTGVNTFILPYTRGGKENIERRRNLLERDVFGTRDFLEEVNPNFAYTLRDEKRVETILGYNETQVNLTEGFNQLSPGAHRLRTRKTNDNTGVGVFQD